MEFTKAHNYFDMLKMVCNSVAKDSTRYALCHVEVNEKHIVSTDGRRLALMDNNGILEPGRYSIGKNIQSKIQLFKDDTIEGNFPKYEDIIPIDYEKTSKKLQGVVLDTLTQTAFRIFSKGVCITLDFIKDYLSADRFYIQESDKPDIADNTRPVVFTSELSNGIKFVGVIMPINAD